MQALRQFPAAVSEAATLKRNRTASTKLHVCCWLSSVSSVLSQSARNIVDGLLGLSAADFLEN
jgi:hypothetical protein